MSDDRSMTMAENTEQYVPDDDHMRAVSRQGYAQGDFDKHEQAWAAWASAWASIRDDLVKAEALAPVLALHQPSEYGCQQECRESDGSIAYPCPTIRAIEQEGQTMTKPDLWHAPWPGPWPSWDWRCRVCSEPVDDHPRLIRRLIHAWRNR